MNNDIQTKKYLLKKTTSLVNYQINYEEELNSAQLDAVKTIDGPVLVIAGAGSGKTRTLVYRVARLIESGIKPENILLLTFTRKSSNEMLNRAALILDTRCENVAGGTFHSFANLILRKYSRYLELNNSFTILDRSDAEDAINLIRSKCIKKVEKRFPKKSTICSIYSSVINRNKPIADIIDSEYPHFRECTDQITEICRQYATYKRQSSLLDYDDLLLYLRTLLESNETIRKNLSEQYKYIMIDEYQDTNSLQADIIRLLASSHSNVMAVGDDAQSIYSFRGADFKNIMNFPSLFENTKIIKLEQNYRSTQKILNLTNEIIKHAKEKFTKNLFTKIEGGDLPAVIMASDQQTEAAFTCQRILELLEEDIPLSEIAVLARSARNTYPLEMELGKRGIPFKKFGGFKFIETAHIKDIISHLRVVVNNADQISWYRILLLINGVGTVTTEKLIPLLSSTPTQSSLSIIEKRNDGVGTLLEAIEKIKCEKLKPFEAAKIFIEYYYPILTAKYDDYNKREKDLEHFIYIAKQYDSLEQFLSDLTIDPPESSLTDVEEGARPDEYLTVSTIHSAKGLEWHSVFISGAVEGRFPSVYAYNSDEEMEEERRLMYVATTRAKKNLYLTYPIDMFDYSMNMVLSKPSRFIEDIQEDIIEKWSLEKE
jgi:DNA helicase-2/ATP-dependent DNA helicase PcrA